ncbi:MAG: NADH-quinone oxidoreductase subunit J [Acidobacteria bacterium]|nr:NADH-quinone oxidoreductase subunit J [Acidobacteriota bacterium]
MEQLAQIQVSHLFFLAFASLAVVAAFNVILQRNPIYSAIGLIVVLCCLAGLFLTLSAQFIAAIQIIVYAGAIMVLFVFVIMLLNVREEEAIADRQKYLKFLAVPLFLALIAEVMAVLKTMGNNPVASSEIPGTVESLGYGMFSSYVLPFEATSVLILMAIVGSMLLARRESAEDTDDIEAALNAANVPTAVSEENEEEEVHA